MVKKAKNDNLTNEDPKTIAKKATEIKKHLNSSKIETSADDLHILIQDSEFKIKEYRRLSYASEKNKNEYENMLSILKGENLAKANRYAKKLANDDSIKPNLDFRRVLEILGTDSDDAYAELKKYVDSVQPSANKFGDE